MPDIPLAYPVPFVVIRERAPVFGLRNASLERLSGITLSLLGPGVLPALPPLALPPGATVWFPIRGDDLARATLLVVRWLRSDDGEYLWRVAF